MKYFKYSRVVTGIQRVQTQIIASALELGLVKQAFKIVFFDGRCWNEISHGDFRLLVDSAEDIMNVSESAWSVIESEVRDRSTATKKRFQRNEVLINLGTMWAEPDYFLEIRLLKLKTGLRYITFVHDCIPLVVPQYCDNRMPQRFKSWIIDTLRYADLILTNSLSTAKDLRSFAADGRRSSAPIAVIRLDGDIRQAEIARDKEDSQASALRLLERLGVRNVRGDRSDFVLMVGTLEARKNHLLAFKIWKRLLDKHGAESVPHLLCIGKEGWKFSAANDFLAQFPEIMTRISLVSGVPDSVLAELYKRCSFSIFPSHYEGWGLPVTESLCYSRLPVVSRNSSLPEAGLDCADYFDVSSFQEGYVAVERAIFEHAYRRQRERYISDHYQPRAWSDVALDVVDAIHGTARSEQSSSQNIATLARYAYLNIVRALGRIMRPVRSGSALRSALWEWRHTHSTRSKDRERVVTFASVMAEAYGGRQQQQGH